MGEIFGALFIFLVIWGLYRFLYAKHKAINHVKEPSVERIALDRKNIANMVVDVPNILVIGNPKN